MKKLICFLSIISVLLAFQPVSNAAISDNQYVDYWKFQHRLYEWGLEIYRLQFSVKNDIGIPGFPDDDIFHNDDDIKQVSLEYLGPGTPATWVFERGHTGSDYLWSLLRENYYWVSYDGGTGQFNYDVDLHESPLWCISIFDLDNVNFPSGEYELKIVFDDNSEILVPDTYERENIIDLPSIDSATISASCTPEGVWFTWEPPLETFDRDISTRPAIEFYAEGSTLSTQTGEVYAIYSRVPFHMGYLFVPEPLFSNLMATWDDGDGIVSFLNQTRTNDQNERRYSNYVLFNYPDCKIKVEKKKK